MDYEFEYARQFLSGQSDQGFGNPDICPDCGSDEILYDHTGGCTICSSCGIVVCGQLYGDTANVHILPVGSYKRVHHWHERISQLCLQETPVPEVVVEAVRDGLDGKAATKDNIRQLLRSLGYPRYIERVSFHIVSLCTLIKNSSRCSGFRSGIASLEYVLPRSTRPRWKNSTNCFS